MIPLIIISGPTATGKSRIAVELAKQIDAEIISADSMQVYRQMDIGSAKVTPSEMQGVPHHLIDILDPSEEFNVALFKKLAKEAIADISSRGKIPIIAGGTGFYIQSVLYDIDFDEQKSDEKYRQYLSDYARENGNDKLHLMLLQADPKSAALIPAGNVKRVIRALEFYKLSGYPISEHNEAQREKTSPYSYAYFVLTDDRKRLYDNIDKRVDMMISDGLVEEVKQLKVCGCKRGMVSMDGLGYKEILDYLDGKLTLDEAVYIIKRDTRHFAKRQLTWFRREKDVIWLDKTVLTDDSLILNEIMATINKKGVLC